MAVFVQGEHRRDLGARAASQRAEHTGQYGTRYTGDGNGESRVTYQDWPAAREYGPTQLPPLHEGNSNSGGGKKRECSQGKMASHSEEVCIYLDSLPPSPRVTSCNRVRSSYYVDLPLPLQPPAHHHQYPVVSGTPRSVYHCPSSEPQPPLQAPRHHCHPPVVSGTPRSDYRNPALAPPPSPPLTPTVKAERRSSYNQHQQPYWKSLQPAGFAAAPQQSQFMDMFCGPPPSLSQVRLVG